MTKYVPYDALRVLPPGAMPPDGFTERIEEKRSKAQHNREVNTLRERIGAGDRDAEFELASKLFPDGLGRPSHGPDTY